MEHSLYNTHVKLLAFDLNSLTQTSSSSSDPISFSRNGALLSRAETVGTVTSRDLKPNKFLRFTIDDGTGCVSCILWLNQLSSPYFSRRSPPDVRLIAQHALRFAAEIKLGVVARVRGKITSYRGVTQITVSDVVIERDPNVEMLHWLDCISQKILDITKYGAVGDGQTDDSPAFVNAWKYLCQGINEAINGIPTLNVPEGKTFLLQRLKFEGPCNTKNVHLQVLGNLLAPARGAWKECDSEDWLSFSNVENLMLDGSGKIDGQGAACGLTFLNSPQAHIGINSCDNADVSHLNIHAPEDSPNTDGIDISFSSHVTIRDSSIGTGDDCISIGDRCSFLSITNIACGPGHGISVGSLGEDGASGKVDNIYVKDCSFTGTTNGGRIKTWQGGSGYARNITFERIKLDRAQYPIIIDQYYCNGEHDCKSQSSAVVVADVMYIDFEGTSATEEAIKLDCDQVSGGCHNIVMDRINIMPAVRDMKIFATCKNAKGTYVGTTVPNVPCLQSSATEPTRPTTIYTGSGGSGSANLHINYYLFCPLMTVLVAIAVF
ncbi:hypothetical protein COP1_031210 [Malus domestica]